MTGKYDEQKHELVLDNGITVKFIRSLKAGQLFTRKVEKSPEQNSVFVYVGHATEEKTGEKKLDHCGRPFHSAHVWGKPEKTYIFADNEVVCTGFHVPMIESEKRCGNCHHFDRKNARCTKLKFDTDGDKIGCPCHVPRESAF